MLLARIDEAFPLTCPQCGTGTRIVASVTEAAPVQRILNHSDEPTTPPRIAPARRPPLSEEDDSGITSLDEGRFTGDPLARPQPAHEIDQRVT
jgi:hypothetical protein